MSDAPERIWAWDDPAGDADGVWYYPATVSEFRRPELVEYIRADIHAAEVERLREALEKLRKRVAFYDGVYQPLEYRQSDPE